jgi:hypothetical protein
MIDSYARIVLTVIALALSILALRPLAPTPAIAVGTTCGTFTNPCYVKMAP